ncbi:polysaccharide deacetylase, partial [Streptomyces sp. SID5998]|nr:polysaccharide deacetylase [Streptomyces sp. SID5998]
MISLVRRITAACALSAALTTLAACGSTTTQAPHAGHPAPTKSEHLPAKPSATAPTKPPTLTPGPGGLTPVFTNGPRTGGKTVAFTFDADMTADEGPRAKAGEHFDNPG